MTPTTISFRFNYLFFFTFLIFAFLQGRATDTLLYLHLDESSGATAMDISRRANHATLQGNPGHVAGVKNNALHFNGIDEYAHTGLPTGLNKNAFTLAAWVKHDAINNPAERYISIQSERAVIRHNGAGYLFLFFYDNSGALHKLQSSKSLLTAGVWHHVAGTWDGTWLKLYFNGKITDSVSTPGTIDFQTAGQAYISWPWESLKGAMDEVVIYDDALKAKQIDRIYRSPFVNPTVVNNGTDVIIAQAVVTASPYLADSTGLNDCTTAFQRAINSVKEAGGGVVYAPPGLYKINGSLSLGTSVFLSGYWINPDSGGLGKGTILMVYSGKGNSNGTPFINLLESENSGITNLGIWYPEQDPINRYPYPFTISCGTGSSIKNTTLYNSYNGIFFQAASVTTMQNIYGCVLNKGIEVTYSFDFSWAYNIRFSSTYWSQAPLPISNTPSLTQSLALSAYLKNNLIAATYGPVDGYILYGLDAPESKIALLIKKNIPALTAAVPGKLSDLSGFGGVMGKIKGTIVRNDWNAWWYAMPAVNIDTRPELANLHYALAPIYKAAKHGPKDLINVAGYGAVGDAVNDDTQAFKDALAEAGSRGGGIVYVPQGRFKITQPLNIPVGVELRGAIGAVPARIAVTWRETTTLLCYTGKNTPTPETGTAFLTLNSNAGIRGINIVYPEQTDQAIPFPYTIRGNGANIWLKELMISNGYHLVDFASFPCNNFVISGMMGFGMKKGINIGGGTTGGKMEFITHTYGVSINSASATLPMYSYQNIVHYLFGDCSNIQTFGLTGFQPFRQIDFYNQNGKGCSSSEFWLSSLDVGNDANIKFWAGDNCKFYGLWVTGHGTDQVSNWLEAVPGFNGQVDVYAPVFLYNFLHVPMETYLNPAKLNLKFEQSLTTKKVGTATSYLNNNLPIYALDDDANTYWEATAGSELTVALDATYLIDRFSILNADLFQFNENDNTKTVELYSSLDGVNYKKLSSPMSNESWLSSFTNVNQKYQMDAPLDTVRARYIRLKVIEGSFPGGDGHVRIRAFNVFGNALSSANSAPVAMGDQAITKENVPVIIPVQVNDNDADGDVLFTSIVIPARHGMVSVINSDSINYVPFIGFTGMDTIAYRVCDAKGACDTAYAIVLVDDITTIIPSGEMFPAAVYPNPTTDELFIETPHELNVSLVNALGVIQRTWYLSTKDIYQKQRLSLTDLPVGIYFLRMETDRNQTTIKIIKK